jgi:2-enoate reductase
MQLFEPGTIGELWIKNRIAMAAMGIGGLVEPDGRLSQQGIDYYVARAKGGVGLIITSLARVSREIDHTRKHPFVRQLMADSNIYVARLNELADAVHDYRAKVAVQLTAGFGRVAGHEFLVEGGAVGPSAQPCFWDPNVTTRELTTEEVDRLVQAFGFGAEVLKSAGVDAVELHAHEGYLFDQFTTSLWNKRTDKYGGDLDGRLRFALEVVKAIKEGAGTNFPVIYRFGLTHYLPGGREIDEGLEMARRLEAAGVDALHVDAGCYETWYWAHPPTYQPPGCMVDLAEMVKQSVRIPVITVGKLGYPELAERVLQEGKADFIALGRALLADPEWPNKVRRGQYEDIRPCIGDHSCLRRVRERKVIGCTVNPAAGMEKQLAVSRAEKRKSVLVVGGGPGGMQAAMIAALRGHEVHMWEQNDTLGGNLIAASVPGFKRDYRRLTDFLVSQVKKLGVAIELGNEATPELIKDMGSDVVVVATGAQPIIPQVPGREKGRAVSAIDVLLGKHEVRDSVIMIGGGLTGCETALHLAGQGRKLTIVEILDAPVRDLYSANRQHLLKLLRDEDVKILTETSVVEIIEGGIIVRDKYGEMSTLMGDVVWAVGLESNKGLWEALMDTVPGDVHAIGDCVEPRRVISAIWEGFRTARLV